MAGSLLDSLMARREQLAAAQVKTLPFPCWETPSLHLRVHPVDDDTIRRIQRRISQAGRRQESEALLDGDASVVAAATEKVIIGGDTELTLKELGDQLGLDEGFSLGDVIRKLAVRDGDVHALARAVAEVSGHTDGIDILDEAFAGE